VNEENYKSIEELAKKRTSEENKSIMDQLDKTILEMMETVDIIQRVENEKERKKSGKSKTTLNMMG